MEVRSESQLFIFFSNLTHLHKLFEWKQVRLDLRPKQDYVSVRTELHLLRATTFPLPCLTDNLTFIVQTSLPKFINQ